MSFSQFATINTSYRAAMKRIQARFEQSELITGRDMLKLHDRYEYLRAEIAYNDDTVYQRYYWDCNMFNSGLAYFQVVVQNFNKRFTLKMTVNCEPDEMKLASKLIDQISRSFFHAKELLGTSFFVTGGGIELHIGSLRELQSVACRTQSAVLFYVKKGLYDGR